jgi:DNA polymerase-3 subunit epsilon
MSLWRRLLGRGPSLDAAQLARLRAWQALPDERSDVPPGAASWVVVDVEATGLNVFQDRLIAIGAVRLSGGRIGAADAFYRVLRQDRASDTQNILVHRISGTQQLAGDDPVETLLAFLEYAGKAPLAGFHSGFDAIMIDRAARGLLGAGFDRQWLDLAFLAPALHQSGARGQPSLDEWLARYRIDVFKRHDALADALGTARLLQVLLHRAAAQGDGSIAAALERAKSEQWLQQSRR